MDAPGGHNAEQNKPDTERHRVISLTCEILKHGTLESESTVLVTRGWCVCVCVSLCSGKMLAKGYKLLVIRWTSSGSLMYSTVTIVNNTKFFTQNWITSNFKCNWIAMTMFINVTVVVSTQSIHKKNHYIVNLEYI